MIKRIKTLWIGKEEDTLFSGESYEVSVEDEGAGEFVVVAEKRFSGRKIAIDPECWPALKEAIDQMIESCGL